MTFLKLLKYFGYLKYASRNRRLPMPSEAEAFRCPLKLKSFEALQRLLKTAVDHPAKLLAAPQIPHKWLNRPAPQMVNRDFVVGISIRVEFWILYQN